MKKQRWGAPILIGLLITLIILVGVYIYANQFPVRYSTDQADWGAFSDYLGLYLNAANIIILTWIGFITYRTTHSFNSIQLTPFLDFAVNRPGRFADKVNDSWYLINASNAAARNIRLKYFIGDKFESAWVACYSLNGNTNLELPWIHFASRIIVVYSDVLEQTFFRTEYFDLRGRITNISKIEFEGILSSDNMKNYTDLITNFYNHVSVNIKDKEHNGIIDSDNYIEKFLKHHKFNADVR